MHLAVCAAAEQPCKLLAVHLHLPVIQRDIQQVLVTGFRTFLLLVMMQYAGHHQCRRHGYNKCYVSEVPLAFQPKVLHLEL